MPYGVREQDCTDSNGNSGSHVVFKKDTGKQVSCHESESEADQHAQRLRMIEQSSSS